MARKYHKTKLKWTPVEEYAPQPIDGVESINQDGIQRQTLLRRCETGLRVKLVRDKKNPEDANAIAVDSKHGRIGYVAPDAAAMMAPGLDSGRVRFKGTLEDVRSHEGDQGIRIWEADLKVARLEKKPTEVFSPIRFAWHWLRMIVLFAVPFVYRLLRTAVSLTDRFLGRLARGDATIHFVYRAFASLVAVLLIAWLANSWMRE